MNAVVLVLPAGGAQAREEVVRTLGVRGLRRDAVGLVDDEDVVVLVEDPRLLEVRPDTRAVHPAGFTRRTRCRATGVARTPLEEVERLLVRVGPLEAIETALAEHQRGALPLRDPVAPDPDAHREAVAAGGGGEAHAMGLGVEHGDRLHCVVEPREEGREVVAEDMLDPADPLARQLRAAGRRSPLCE